MIARRPQRSSRAGTLGLAALGLALAVGGPAAAQHTPDPYNIVGEYNRQYEPYMYAVTPNNDGAMANQARSGTRSANRFQSYLDGEGDDMEDAGRLAAPRLSGPGVPYYRANRRFDHQFQREYQPNRDADSSFYRKRSYYDDQQQRNDKYFQALHEPDSKKRSQLLREYNLENLRAARTLSSGRTAKDREAERDRLTPALRPSRTGSDPDWENAGGGGPSASPAPRLSDSPFSPPALPDRVRSRRPLSPPGNARSPVAPAPNGTRSSRSQPSTSSGLVRSRSTLRPGALSVPPFSSGSLLDLPPATRRSASDILRESEAIDGGPSPTPLPRRSSAPPPR